MTPTKLWGRNNVKFQRYIETTIRSRVRLNLTFDMRTWRLSFLTWLFPSTIGWRLVTSVPLEWCSAPSPFFNLAGFVDISCHKKGQNSITYNRSQAAFSHLLCAFERTNALFSVWRKYFAATVLLYCTMFPATCLSCYFVVSSWRQTCRRHFSVT